MSSCFVLRPCFSSLILLAAAFGVAASLRGEPVISEFMASNRSALLDEDGEASDWIEIHNPDHSAFSLAGWHLTDAAKKKTKWTFPAVTVAPRGYLVVFASGKDRREAARSLHTNFSLDAAGEYLALVRPDGETVASEFAPYPAQSADVSFGADGFQRAATPGSPNSAALLPETVTFSQASGAFTDRLVLELGGAGPGQHIRYRLGSPMSGRATTAADPAGDLWYDGPITLDSTASVTATIYSNDSELSGVSATAHFVRVHPDLKAFASTLPVLVLEAPGATEWTKDGVDRPTWLFGYEPGAAIFAGRRTLATPAVMGVRGSSSAGFPKKGYNVKLCDDRGTARAHVVAGLPPAERWALVAPWSYDPTYLSNAFVYDLSNRIGRWAPRTRLVEVFLNSDGGDLDPSDYVGIYVVTERIEPGEDRVAIAAMGGGDVAGRDLTGGYILKIDAPAPEDVAWQTKRGVSAQREFAVMLASPQADDATEAQVDYIRDYVQRMEDALAASLAVNWRQRTYLDYIDRASWVDHHLIHTFTGNPDAFVRSAYFTKDRGGKMQAGPVWDFDRALGSWADARSVAYFTWSSPAGVDHWRTGWWGMLAQDPEFRQEWIDRWQSLRRTELSDRTLIDRMAAWSATVGAAAVRDAVRWPDNASTHGSYAAQIAETQRWLTRRAQWIDGQFVAAPEVRIAGEQITFIAPEGAQLVYTFDGTDPRSVGGFVAPNARHAARELTAARSANVQVRSWVPGRDDTFPGTPWSSLARSDGSSTLGQRSRIANFSLHADLGASEVATMGTAVADTEAKRYIFRAVGPGLAALGVTNPAPATVLTLVDQFGTELSRNRGWDKGADAQELARSFSALGAMPLASGSGDSAITPTLPAGTYALGMEIGDGRPGHALFELYETDDTGRIANLSVYAPVTGSRKMTGGFVVKGEANKRVLLRAAGNALSALGINGALVDPALEVFAGARLVASSETWPVEDAAIAKQAAVLAGAFAFPADRGDAAMLLTLAPGAYTFEVRSRTGGNGPVLFELYDVP